VLRRDVDDLPGEATDLPSVGAEAYGFNEFGSEVRFSGTNRVTTAGATGMSSPLVHARFLGDFEFAVWS